MKINFHPLSQVLQNSIYVSFHHIKLVCESFKYFKKAFYTIVYLFAFEKLA